MTFEQVVIDLPPPFGPARLRAAWWNRAAGGTPIVLLHEALGSLTQWRDFPAALAAATGRAVFAFERRGHGLSSPRDRARGTGYHAEEADALWSTLEAAGIGTAILFGHSDGGTIALQAAADRPGRVAALITLAAHVTVDERALRGIQEAAGAYDRGLRERLIRHHGDNTDTVFAAWRDTWLSEPFRSWDMRGVLPAIGCPTLALQGARDEYGLPDQVTWIVGGVRGPVEAHLMPGLRHQPHLEAPAVVIGHVASFLGAIAGLE